MLYYFDLIVYSSNPREFLTSRAETMGSSNYASLGRLMIGDHKTVCDSINAQQSRSHYLGRAKLNPSKLPENFVLFLSDVIESESEIHQAIHTYIWETIMPGVLKRVEKDDAAVFSEYVTMLAEAGKDGTPSSDILQRLCIRYVFHALLGSIDDSFVELIHDLFFDDALASYVGGAMQLPFLCSCIIPCCYASKRQTKIDEAVAYIVKSPTMENYEAPIESITKEGFSEIFLAISGIAGVLGTYNLLLNVFNEIPKDCDLDATDSQEVLMFILEAARIRAPVNNVNFRLQEERVISAHGREVTLGEGTLCAACIGMASQDSKVFENPKEFNPKRENLLSDLINFNHVGFSPEGSGTRQCPGRNLPIKFASDLLMELQNYPDRECTALEIPRGIEGCNV
eukprot:CAMPEP_0194215780 /NCGR_PEP_ID=MMETSP0156-20130528/17806_1 /TAXON_ID=33649 /ORGANISM="Thalassionema nitzschioides, Strain L26-B" /LENGTH=397 /DNA_ID=CAMNT_0038944389 /DNA_START=83 /DNA_END=1276 /DNA_ORIENTATION=-